MQLYEAVALAAGGAVAVGFIVWLAFKVAMRHGQYSAADTKTRNFEKYMEKAKQGMK